MEILSITEIWRYLRWLPGFILRRIFTKERLADLVLIDVRARHESVAVNLAEAPTFRIYFQIINLSPFVVELDRAEVEFLCAGVKVSCQHIRKATYKPGEAAMLFVEGDINEGKADQIAKLREANSSSIEVHCQFNCPLHSFTKQTGVLEGGHVRFINQNSRLKGK